MVSLFEEEEEEQPIGDKRNGKVQREQACLNPKRHIPPVSLFLRQMVAVRCFVWSPALQLRSVSYN